MRLQSPPPTCPAARPLRSAHHPGLLALAAALVAALVGVLGAGAASAHAALLSASPASGARLTAAPPEVALRFNEEIGTEFVTVAVTKGGRSAVDGDPEVAGSTVSQALDPDIEAGEWTVTYRVVSADGHPVSGSYAFTYDPIGGEGDDAAGSSTTSSGSAATSADEPSPASTTGSVTSTTDGTSSTSSSTSSTSSTGGSTGSETTTQGPPATSTGSTAPSSPTSSTSSTSSTSDETTGTPSTTSASGGGPTEGAAASGSDGAGVPGWLWPLLGLLALGGLGSLLLSRRRRGGLAAEEEIDLRDPR